LVDFLQCLRQLSNQFSESQAAFGKFFRVLGGSLYAAKRFVGKITGRIFILYMSSKEQDETLILLISPKKQQKM
jgi:hypothetical protein